ncbi:MAG: hypothetical protein MI924_26265 [Chloroflexales bacterium]|nr:hypothetical protein [Chloroflexales bacterium]
MMEERCHSEIVELHQFFQDWFNAVISDTDAEFDRFADVVASTFAIVSPAGKLQERAPLLAGLRAAYGKSPGIRIWIEDVRLCFQENDIAIVTYAEWQQLGEAITARLSTALFRERSGPPNGLEWLHVHRGLPLGAEAHRLEPWEEAPRFSGLSLLTFPYTYATFNI